MEFTDGPPPTRNPEHPRHKSLRESVGFLFLSKILKGSVLIRSIDCLTVVTLVLLKGLVTSQLVMRPVMRPEMILSVMRLVTSLLVMRPEMILSVMRLVTSLVVMN